MQKMSTPVAWAWMGGGLAVYFAATLIALLAPLSAAKNPPVTAQQFFTTEQYDILYGKNGKKPFDPQNPDPAFVLSTSSSQPTPPKVPVNPTKQQEQQYQQQLKAYHAAEAAYAKAPQGQVAQLASWGYASCVANDGTAAQQGFGDSGCFCENAPAVRQIFSGGTTFQPQNTWSAFGLGMIGVALLAILVFTDVPTPQNYMTVTYVFSLCYAFLTILLGPLSMMLHAGLRALGEFGDDLSLYLWFSFVACYAFYRLFVSLANTNTSPADYVASSVFGWSLAIFGVAWAACLALPIIFTGPFHAVSASIMTSSTTWYLILGVAALAGEGLLLWRKSRNAADAPKTTWCAGASNSFPEWVSDLWSLPPRTGGTTMLALGGFTFLIAIIIWLFSYSEHALCFPQGPQGHSVFHLLSGLAAVYLYVYYRREGEGSA
jgi:LPXTG-motif cell wall-anchored protein